MARMNSSLFQRIAKHPKTSSKFANDQVIRVSISNVRQANPGVTPNAAAYLFARKHGVSVFRQLSDDDKLSLNHAKTPIENGSASKTKKSSQIKSKNMTGDAIYDPILVKEANANAEIYPYVYILENTLRNLILDKFSTLGNWWIDKKIVKQDIQDYAKRIADAERKHKWVGKRGQHPIYYVGLEHLFKIIEINFNPHFKNIFDINNLKTWINECASIRNLVAHNVRTQKSELENIKIRTKYICTSIKNS